MEKLINYRRLLRSQTAVFPVIAYYAPYKTPKEL